MACLLPPESASGLLHGHRHRAAEVAASQQIRAVDLLRAGIVDEGYPGSFARQVIVPSIMVAAMLSADGVASAWLSGMCRSTRSALWSAATFRAGPAGCLGELR